MGKPLREKRLKSSFELDLERLGTTDEHGNRVYLYPDNVKGRWKSRRRSVYWMLIGLYLVLPWVYINEKPALQVDIFHREFTFMGNTLHGVEPVLFFLLIAIGLFSIAFLTSLFGRVWCGWACPQTVFIQSIFWKIEEWVEGSSRRRRERAKGPWSVDRGFRALIKWALFTLVSLHIAHTFIGYVVGPRELLAITLHAPVEHWGLFLATMTLTAIFLFDFGWFREQFCIIMCPYGRIQSVMMDENSLVVGYDTKRGEPRRNPGVVERGQEGDCINCYACVKVCPTGIDIRRGTQLECIACTQCIDACDDIMEKTKRPPGLIRYTSENEVNALPRKRITPRSMLYAGVGLLLMFAFIIAMNMMTRPKMVFLRSVRPFTAAEGGQQISNQFTLKLTHQGSAVYTFELQPADQALKGQLQVLTPVHPIVLDHPQKKIIVFLRFPVSLLTNGTRRTTLLAVSPEGQVLASQEVTLVGPVR